MDVFVFFVDACESSQDVSTDDIIKKLPQCAVQSILSVKNPQVAYVKAVSALLKYTVLSKMLSVNFNHISFGLMEKGKPYVSNFDGIHFNISHTKNACAGIFAPFEVGVDIEFMRPTDMSIAKRFFTANEQKYISEDESLSVSRFFEIWTKKEAFIKLTGEGLGRPLSSFDVFDEGLGVTFSHYINGSFSVSACAYAGNTIQKTLKVISAEELFSSPAAI